jgi:hypothetical protein
VRDGRAVPPFGWSHTRGALVRFGDTVPHPPLVRRCGDLRCMAVPPRDPSGALVFREVKWTWLLGRWPQRCPLRRPRPSGPPLWPRGPRAGAWVTRYAVWRTGAGHAAGPFGCLQETPSWDRLLEAAGVRGEAAENERNGRWFDTPRVAFLRYLVVYGGTMASRRSSRRPRGADSGGVALPAARAPVRQWHRRRENASDVERFAACASRFRASRQPGRGEQVGGAVFTSSQR